jgi:very-short-patch-repair endonuclease
MKPRHFDIDRKALKRARRLRKNMTEEERLLWSDLKGFRKFGLAFRKQAPVGPFIVDFLCRKAKLIVEVDGEHHGEDEQWNHDHERDAWLAEHGYKVLRFWNADVRRSLDDVTEAIFDEAKRLKDLRD